MAARPNGKHGFVFWHSQHTPPTLSKKCSAKHSAYKSMRIHIQRSAGDSGPYLERRHWDLEPLWFMKRREPYFIPISSLVR
jgi:hypothetical protein